MMQPDQRGAGRDDLALRAILNGDEQAWQALYDGTYESLHRYVSWRLAGVTESVEEVVQETWMTAVRRIGDFEPRQGRFEDWLRGIAANVLRNHLRSDNGRRRRLRHWTGGPARDEAPESALEQRERAEAVAHALAALPAHYENVLRAKYVDRLSMAEIARELDATTKAVESLLTRARQAFREAYQRTDDV